MNIETEKLKKEDLKYLVDWTTRCNGGNYTVNDLPIDMESAKKWFLYTANQDGRLDCIVYLYYTPVALIGLTEIVQDSASLYLRLGETSYNSTRLATYAMLRVLDRAFQEMGLEKIYVSLENTSQDVRILFERIGFEASVSSIKSNLILTKASYSDNRYLF